jgi:DNA-binding CsgD family transcriptional regulator
VISYLIRKTLDFLLWSCIILIYFSNTSCKNYNKQGQQNKDLAKDQLVKHADSLFQLGEIYSRDSLNQEKALSLCQGALKIYKQINNTEQIARVYQRIGIAYDYLEDYSKSIVYAKKANALFVETGNTRYAGKTLNDVGIAYLQTGEIDSSIICLKKGLVLSKMVNDTSEIIEFYQNIGICYNDAGDYKKAVESHLEGLRYCEKIGFIEDIFDMYLNLADDYHNMGNIDMVFTYMGKADELIDEYDDPYGKVAFYNMYAVLYYDNENIEKSKIYLNKSLEISQEINYRRGIAAAYSNLAILAIEEKEYNKAEELSQLSVKLEEEINNIPGVILSLCEMAKWQYEQQFYNQAIVHLKRAETLCKEKGLYNNLVEVRYHFYQAYSKSRNMKKALRYCESYHEIKDSLANLEVKEKIADLEIKYQTEKKQKEIELLSEANKTKKQKIKARNRFITVLVLLLILIISIAYFLRQQRLKKLYRIESELQQYILRLKDIDAKEKDDRTDITSITFSKKYDLTERETEVLMLISEGMSNVEIAEKIYVSPNTIKFHIKNIYLKLDVKNRVEALNKIKKSG